MDSIKNIFKNFFKKSLLKNIFINDNEENKDLSTYYYSPNKNYPDNDFVKSDECTYKNSNEISSCTNRYRKIN